MYFLHFFPVHAFVVDVQPRYNHTTTTLKICDASFSVWTGSCVDWHPSWLSSFQRFNRRSSNGRDRPVNSPFLLLIAIFFPLLQGFFNFLIYIRPRYLRYREQPREVRTSRFLVEVSRLAVISQDNPEEDNLEVCETSVSGRGHQEEDNFEVCETTPTVHPRSALFTPSPLACCTRME
jgi:hypothetical protein